MKNYTKFHNKKYYKLAESDRRCPARKKNHLLNGVEVKLFYNLRNQGN